jgi:hypothetical protein
MKRVLLSALLAATALQASAGIVNGSFESGLTSWTTFGSTGVFDNPPTSGTTTDGFKSARVTALFGGPNNAAGLEAFVGVTDAALRAIKSPAGYTPAFINGGAIQQTFTVAGGDTLQFDWRFATNETTLANDFSFFVLDGIALALGDTGGTGTVFESLELQVIREQRTGLPGLPGELRLVAAEVAVGGGLAVDRAQQVERLDDALRAQVEVLAISSTIFRRLTLPVPKVSTISDTGRATPMA